MMVEVNLSGTITNISLISHEETPSYVSDEAINKLIRQFIALDANSSFVIGQDIDAISGATITSEKAARTVEKSLKDISDDFYSYGGSDYGSDPTTSKIIILTMVIFFVSSFFWHGILDKYTNLSFPNSSSSYDYGIAPAPGRFLD